MRSFTHEAFAFHFGTDGAALLLCDCQIPSAFKAETLRIGSRHSFSGASAVNGLLLTFHHRGLNRWGLPKVGRYSPLRARQFLPKTTLATLSFRLPPKRLRYVQGRGYGHSIYFSSLREIEILSRVRLPTDTQLVIDELRKDK